MTRIDVRLEEAWDALTEFTGAGIRRRGYHASRATTSDLRLPTEFDLAKSAISSVSAVHQVFHTSEASIAANVLPALAVPPTPKLLAPEAR